MRRKEITSPMSIKPNTGYAAQSQNCAAPIIAGVMSNITAPRVTTGDDHPVQCAHLLIPFHYTARHQRSSSAANDSFGHNASFSAANVVHNYQAMHPQSLRPPARHGPARPVRAVCNIAWIERTRVKSIFDGGPCTVHPISWVTGGGVSLSDITTDDDACSLHRTWHFTTNESLHVLWHNSQPLFVPFAWLPFHAILRHRQNNGR